MSLTLFQPEGPYYPLLIGLSPLRFLTFRRPCMYIWSLLYVFYGIVARTTNTQWRHKPKISEKFRRCGRLNMLWPYLKIWIEIELSAVWWRQFPLRASVVCALWASEKSTHVRKLKKKWLFLVIAYVLSSKFKPVLINHSTSHVASWLDMIQKECSR